MMNDSGGDIAAGPAGPAGSKAEVGVFAIEEKTVIETVGFGEHGASIKGGGSACEENVFGMGELFGGEAVAALFASPVEGDQHAGGIEGVFLSEEPDLRGGGTGVGVCVEGFDHFVEEIRVGGGVVVDNGDKVGWGMAGGEIKCGSEADVGRRIEDGNGRAGCPPRPARFHATFPTVINNHDAKVPICLPVQAFDAFP